MISATKKEPRMTEKFVESIQEQCAKVLDTAARLTDDMKIVALKAKP